MNNQVLKRLNVSSANLILYTITLLLMTLMISKPKSCAKNSETQYQNYFVRKTITSQHFFVTIKDL